MAAKKTGKMTAGKAAAILITAILVGVLAGGAFGYTYSKTRSAEENGQVPGGASGSAQDLSIGRYSGSSDQELIANPLVSGKVIQATKTAQNSVVVIVTAIREEVTTIFGQSYVEEYSALGSGIIFKEENNKVYVLTNAHVLEGAHEAYLYYSDEDKIPIYLVGESVSDDVAVVYALRSDIPDEVYANMKVATLGDSDLLRKGDLAIAIGSPYSQNMDHTTTVGIITGVNQKLAIEDRVIQVLQTDASLNPGNSGGALINENGEVIGINSAGIRTTDVEGLGFAITINHAKEVIAELFEHGSREKASLGLESSTFLDERTARLYGMTTGLYVYSVTEGGAAEAAGIMRGDIITAVNGQKLTDASSLETILNGLSGGDTVTVEYVHGRTLSPRTAMVTLDSVTDENTYLPKGPDAIPGGKAA